MDKAKNQPQGYRYGILKKLLQTEYHSLKLKLEAEREEQRKYPPSVLEDCFRRAETSRHEEGIGDISELLDDWGKEEELYAHHAPPGPSMLQEVLAETKRQKKRNCLAGKMTMTTMNFKRL